MLILHSNVRSRSGLVSDILATLEHGSFWFMFYQNWLSLLCRSCGIQSQCSFFYSIIFKGVTGNTYQLFIGLTQSAAFEELKCDDLVRDCELFLLHVFNLIVEPLNIRTD